MLSLQMKEIWRHMLSDIINSCQNWRRKKPTPSAKNISDILKMDEKGGKCSRLTLISSHKHWWYQELWSFFLLCVWGWSDVVYTVSSNTDENEDIPSSTSSSWLQRKTRMSLCNYHAVRLIVCGRQMIKRPFFFLLHAWLIN